MDKAYLMDEIDRAFWVLGFEGFFQNLIDIKDWEDRKLVTPEEIAEIRAYNKKKKLEYL